MSDQGDIYIGEYFAGGGANAAHINIVAGPRAGPVGAAFIGTLASPRPGHIPFLTVAQPSVPIKPYTLFVNKAELRGEQHERATWGAAQAGVARGIMEAEHVLPEGAADNWVIIASVWVDWTANDLDTVYANNREASRGALARALRNEPRLDEVRVAASAPFNPFYTPPVQ
jgi:5,6,7,8-tetrahydromethanopterin hydro-lyase